MHYSGRGSLHLRRLPDAVHGPIAFALTGAKADERETLLDLLAAEPHLVAARPGQTLIGDKNYFGRDFEHQMAAEHPAAAASPQG